MQLVALAAIFLLFCYLRFNHRWTHELWADEVMTVRGLKTEFIPWLQRGLPESDFHFAGSYLLLYPIGHWVSSDKFIVAIPYILLTGLFYYLFARVNWARLVRLEESSYILNPRWINVIACMLVTVNNTLIIYAFEMRPYSVLSLLMLLALLLGDRVSDLERFSFKYAIFGFVLILFHNFGLLMLVVGLGYSIVFRFCEDREVVKDRWWNQIIRFRPAFLTALTSFIFTLPMFWMYTQRPVLNLFHGTGFQVHQFIHPGMKGVLQVLGIYYGFQSGYKWIRLVIVVLVMFGLLLCIFRKRWMVLLFPIWFVVGPTFIIYLFDNAVKFLFIQRQFLWVIPFHAVFVGMTVHHSMDWFCQRFTSRRGQRFWQGGNL